MEIRRRKLKLSSGRGVTSEIHVPDGFLPGGPAAIIAHGTTNSMDHPVVLAALNAFADANILGVRFNFPYAEEGGRTPDDRETLEDTFRRVVSDVVGDAAFAPGGLLLGGKSLGGVIAARIASSEDLCKGLFFLGFPLHPPARPESADASALLDTSLPCFVASASEDAFCIPERLQEITASIGPRITNLLIDGADHSFTLLDPDPAEQQNILDAITHSLRQWAVAALAEI